MAHIVPAIIQFVLAGALLIAVITDFRAHKIYNWLTLPAIFAGIILNLLPGGHGFLFSIGGIAVASLSLLMFLLAGALGAGDVKLLWAVGALTGPAFTGWSLLGTALAGGLLALAYAAKRGAMRASVQNTVAGTHILASTHSTDAVAAMGTMSAAGKMPYAPAIALGVVIAGFLRHSGVF